MNRPEEERDRSRRGVFVVVAHQETHTQSANLELGKKRLAQLTRQNRIRHLANVMISTEKDALEEIRQEFTA